MAAADRDEVQRQRRAEYEQDSERTELQHKLDYVVKLAQGGDLRKATSHLTSLGIAPDTADTAAKIDALQFPRRASQRPAQAAARAHRPADLVLSEEDVLDGIRKAPLRSATTGSGWRNEFFKANNTKELLGEAIPVF